ncbi:MAG TPA: AMP-binding protein [Kiloniellales bacterium]
MHTLQDLLPGFSALGEKPAVISMGGIGAEAMSYAELARQVARLAHGLRESGLERGEAVAILAPNSAAWIVASLAVVAAGGLLVPLDLRLPPKLLAHEIADSGCTRVFTSREALSNLEQATPEGRTLEIYRLDNADADATGRSWRSLLSDETGALPVLTPDAPAVLFYTSGTTGLPKGVPLSHGNLLANLEGLRGQNLAYPGVRALLPLPLHHVYPFMVGMLVPLDGGATIVLPAGATGPEILRALRLGRATALVGVPGLYEAMVTAIRRRIETRGKLSARLFTWLFAVSLWLRRRFGWRLGRLLLYPVHRGIGPRLRIVASGGAALRDEVAWDLEALGWQVLTGYGLTETSPIISFTGLGRGRIGSAGRPLAGLEIRFAPVEGLPGGEIQVRGPNVFAGYRNRPDATERAFTPDGWFRTGDLGEEDSDGYLRILARVDEMIVLAGGKNVQPEDVEERYQESPHLREVAVLERDGRLSALVVPDVTAIRRTGADDMNEVVRSELARVSRTLRPHERVSDYRITLDSLPRTSLGKIKRHLLPDLFDGAGKTADLAALEESALSDSDRSLLSSATARAVLETLRQLAPERAVTPDADLQVDLGIDSLAWVSLTLELERQGVYLDEAAIGRLTTVRSLLEATFEAKEQAFGRAGEGPIPAQQLLWLEPTGPVLQRLGLLLLVLNRSIFRWLFRLRATGVDRLPRGGPFVLTPNHASFLDVFALAAALPSRVLVETYWAGTVDYLFNSRLRRAFSRLAHVFPIDPVKSPVSSFLMGAEVLKRGRVLVWFPEGRRSPDGQLRPFMAGIGRLVQQPGWLVVPVHIGGTFEAWPRGRRFPRLRRLSVAFGEPISRDDLIAGGSGSGEDARLADGLWRKLSALMSGEGAVPRRRRD